jgi:periplasmic protein TonB
VIARLGGVTLSVLLHAGLIALLLAWSAVDWTRPLFVDLGERAESPGSPTGEPSGVRSARPAGRAAGPALPPARASARPEPVAPVASGGPASAPAPPPVAPAVPPALAVAPEPVAEPAATPAPAPAAVPTAPSASSSVSASDSGSGAVAGGGAQTRGDGDRGSGGGPGASLALVTPGAGGSGVAPPEYGAYLRQFRQRVQESLVYPLAARRQGLGGTVELHVWLEATGRVRDVQVARSSSHRVLDDAAVEAIRRLGPVPFPESLPRRPLLVRIPLVYELR